jgi:hypothetical protein
MDDLEQGSWNLEYHDIVLGSAITATTAVPDLGFGSLTTTLPDHEK